MNNNRHGKIGTEPLHLIPILHLGRKNLLKRITRWNKHFYGQMRNTSCKLSMTSDPGVPRLSFLTVIGPCPFDLVIWIHFLKVKSMSVVQLTPDKKTT